MKPIYVKKNGEVNKISGIVNPSSYSADDITYDGSTSGLTADDVQEAIDEIVGGLGTAASKNVGIANGVAELDSSGKVPSSQLPSYVDDVIEVDDYAHLPITGESGKIYVTRDTNLEYRWSGTTYVQVSKSVALGETSETAYRGDRGKTAYEHATETKLSTATASGLYKVAGTAQGHIASLTAVTIDDIIGLGISVTDENVKQSPSTNNATYEVLFSGSADNIEHTEGVKKSNKLTFNPSTGALMNGNAGVANGSYSHAEGSRTTTQSDYSHAEGLSTSTNGLYSHAEGHQTAASSTASHAEGYKAITIGNYSHAEGYATVASNIASHAEGLSTTASGNYSHAEGVYTSAAGEGQLVIGKYNTPDTTSLFIIGNGTAKTARSNAMTVDATGNLSITKINGVTVGNSPKFTDTDTKVTSVGNHYTPTCSGTFSANASGATAAWSIDVVKGVTLQKDAAGHITGVSVVSGKIPANPNTDTKVTSVGNHYTPTCSGTFSKSASGGTAAWSVDVVTGITLQKDAAGHIVDMSITSGKTAANPVPSNNITGSGTSGYIAKFNGTNTITNGPQIGSDTTKYLRNDGTWVKPPNDNTTYSFTGGTNQFVVTPSTGSASTVTVTPSIGVATTSANGLMSSSDKTKLNGIATGAEVNQNAFSTIGVKVGSTTTNVAADSKTDTVTLIQGTNVTLTADATNDTVTIAATDTNNAVTQNNSTTSAAYRLLLSANANNTSETNISYKSGKFYANPSTGAFYAEGHNRKDITGQTLDLDTLTLSAGDPHAIYYIEKNDGGATNITHRPVTENKPFLLDVELIRWVSTTDYITRQTYRNAANPANEYVRFCTAGTWGSWTTRVFTDTNTNVTQTATTTNANYEVLFSATADNTTRTEIARKNSNLLFNPSTGVLYGTNEMRSRDLSVSSNNGTSGGISLYSSSSQMDNYGLYCRSTDNKEKHGYIQGNWAMYFNMNDQDNHGWIFRRNKTGGNVASIDTKGQAVFNGSVTIGGNAANTSGARLEFNSNTNAVDFIFN